MAVFKKQTILVTGGTGFAGRHAIKRLIKDGHCVCALVRDKARLLKVLGNEYLRFLKVVEIENPEKASVGDLKQLIEENDITTIVHVAAVVGEHKISWDRYFEVNVVWTRNLALAFLVANVKREKFIFTSSVGVYGTIPENVPADESTPYNPDGSYHKSKVLAEEELIGLQSSSNLPLIILRPTILYGNEDKGFLYKFFKLMGKKIFPLCRSNPRIHLLDVEVLADTYAELVKCTGNSTNCIFNVGDGESVEIWEIAQFIKKSMAAGYLKVPFLLFEFLAKLCTFNHQYFVSLKLISKSWSYDVDKLYKTFSVKPMETLQSLGNKYLEWYKGA